MVFVGILLYGLLVGHGGLLTQKSAAVAVTGGQRRAEHLAGSLGLGRAIGIGVRRPVGLECCANVGSVGVASRIGFAFLSIA